MTITLEDSVTMDDLTRMIRTHAHRIAREFSIQCSSYRDDLKQEAWLRVLKPLPLANVKILNVAIRRCLIDFLRKDKQLRNSYRVPTESFSTINDVGRRHKPFDEIDDRDELNVRVHTMSGQQLRIALGLLDGKTQREIASGMGITQPAVSQQLKQIHTDVKAWDQSRPFVDISGRGMNTLINAGTIAKARAE